jgi:DNA ligase D-like protein (predicted ligase)
MMAVPAAALPSGADWSYEVKWDGYRAQIVKNGSGVSLASRNLKIITGQFPAVAAAAARVRAQTTLIDGAIVALDPEGRPSFQALHHWSLGGFSLVYYAFDLLHLDGRNLMRLPLDDRRAALHEVLAGAGANLLLSEPLPGTAQEIEREVRRLQLEGVVAKRRRSRYEPGKRSDAWVKVRFARHQEFVIGGYKPAAATFDSLLAGYYEGRRLLCAGKVRNGFTPHLRAAIFERLKPITIKTCPFVNLPTTRSGHWGEGIAADEMPALRWIKPQLVAEITFVEWTRDGNLRHAAFLGLREDKNARDVRREY